jgi:hypothetical protein
LRRLLRLRRFGLCRRWRRRLGYVVGALAFLQQHGDNRIDLHVLGAFGHHDLADLALVDGLDLHSRLVRLDFGDHIARGDAVAFFHVPLGELALLHGRRERWHGDVDAHWA